MGCVLPTWPYNIHLPVNNRISLCFLTCLTQRTLSLQRPHCAEQTGWSDLIYSLIYWPRPRFLPPPGLTCPMPQSFPFPQCSVIFLSTLDIMSFNFLKSWYMHFSFHKWGNWDCKEAPWDLRWFWFQKFIFSVITISGRIRDCVTVFSVFFCSVLRKV